MDCDGGVGHAEMGFGLCDSYSALECMAPEPNMYVLIDPFDMRDTECLNMRI